MDNKSKQTIKPTSYRLPKKVQALINILAQKLMISKTAVITLAVLCLSERENASVDDDAC